MRVRWLRMLAVEAACLLFTQPVRPLFRLLRRWRGAPGTPIVFVHGYAQSCATFWGLGVRLARRRLGPLYAFDYFSLHDIPTIAAHLERFVERVCEEHRSSGVHLVCHSMGGLVAVEYVRRTAAPRIARCVTVATPHAGVRWAGPIPGACGAQMREGCDYLADLAAVRLRVPFLSICSEDDQLFFARSSPSLASRGGSDLVLSEGGHLAMLFSREVADHIEIFLRPARPHAVPDAIALPELADAAE